MTNHYLPETRRPKLRKLLLDKGFVSAMEVHDAISALIVEKTVAAGRQFDAMWSSSLCDSAVRGKHDIEIVDLATRLKTMEEIMEVTTKPIIFDCDTGGLVPHLENNLRNLERRGISAAVIEDVTGLKKNSLLGGEVQTQESIENFCAKIEAGKKALRTEDFVIVARTESLILGRPMEEALIRAAAYVRAGADAVMIHSRSKKPDEVIEFCQKFRQDFDTPIVAVPAAYNLATEQQLKQAGVNIVIHAHQLFRSAVAAMQKSAASVLTHNRSWEADQESLPLAEVLNILPPE